jgi:hypothetical protein
MPGAEDFPNVLHYHHRLTWVFKLVHNGSYTDSISLASTEKIQGESLVGPVECDSRRSPSMICLLKVFSRFLWAHSTILSNL